VTDVEPQLPLTGRRKLLLAAGGAMFIAQACGAWVVAPSITGPGDASAAALAGLWAASVAWSSVAVLLLVRQADVPDIATASMLVVIAAFAAFTLSAALDVRDSDDAVNVTDALFLGVTGGGLTSVLVWGVALAVARLLRLPTTAGLR
jgi:hypothetical protein